MEETETEAEILELHELQCSYLMLLSATSVTSSTPPEVLKWVEAMRSAILETLGPGGPDLLSVAGFDSASCLGRKLLRLAREGTFLDFEVRKLILKKHNLGRNVPLKNPDRKVSSFARRPRYAEALESTSSEPDQHCKLSGQLHHKGDQDLLAQEISKMVPPLTSRLKDGMTFAGFSREPTKQY